MNLKQKVEVKKVQSFKKPLFIEWNFRIKNEKNKSLHCTACITQRTKIRYEILLLDFHSIAVEQRPHWNGHLERTETVA